MFNKKLKQRVEELERQDDLNLSIFKAMEGSLKQLSILLENLMEFELNKDGEVVVKKEKKKKK